jgi:hypothetical protein
MTVVTFMYEGEVKNFIGDIPERSTIFFSGKELGINSKKSFSFEKVSIR